MLNNTIVVVVAETVAGVLVGWLLATLVESFFHQHLGHASARTRKLFLRAHELLPSLGVFKWLWSAAMAHAVVHHMQTFRQDHVTQFAAATNPQPAVDKAIAAKRLDLADLQSERYGLSLNLVGFCKFSIPFVASWLLLFVSILPALLSLSSSSSFRSWFCVWSHYPCFCWTSLATTSLLPPAFSTWVHPLLHMEHHVAVEQARRCWRPLSWLLDSPYGRLLWLYHDLHHRNREQIDDPTLGINFNLMLGGDWLRGYAQVPTAEDLTRAARDIGGPAYIWK